MSYWIQGLLVTLAMLLSGCALFSPAETPASVGSAEAAIAADPLNTFPPGTLLEVNRTQRKLLGRKLSAVGDQLDPARPSATVTAFYTSRTRPLSKRSRAFLVKYAELADDDEVLPLYTHEIQITEGDLHYWLPVQKEIFAYLVKDLKKGEVAKFKVRHLGFQGKQGFFILIDYDRVVTSTPEKPSA